jgi:hypothetical protein
VPLSSTSSRRFRPPVTLLPLLFCRPRADPKIVANMLAESAARYSPPRRNLPILSFSSGFDALPKNDPVFLLR